jgi:hypothetical protein
MAGFLVSNVLGWMKQLLLADLVPRVTMEHRPRDRNSWEVLGSTRGTTIAPRFWAWNVVVPKPFEEEEIMVREECRPKFQYCPNICLEGLRRSTKLLVSKSRSPYQVLNSEFHKQELYSFYRNIRLRDSCRARNVSEPWNTDLQKLSCIQRVRVTLQLMVSQSVCLGVEPPLGLMTRYFFF